MFENGSEVIQFDCHLHTRKDKEFTFSGVDDRFVTEYIEQLKKIDIHVGIITNHNKFDFDEYKALRDKGKKNDIFLLPGVELSIKEGQSSIHTLIVFNPEEWLKNGIDFISRTIDSFFLNVPDPGNENTFTNRDLSAVLVELEKAEKDYFIIFAHVEQDKGFWKECGGNIITNYAKDKVFRKRVIGFQKVRTRDKLRDVEGWMKYSVAHVEGSDPKKIEDIGKCSKRTYIKIGEYSYEAVKYALMDFNDRVFETQADISHGYIKNVKFIGGKFDEQFFSPSAELNTIIGIRGSGKSSVLEVLRYALSLKPAIDEEYKDGLVESALGPGGKIEVTIVDRNGKEYLLSRILRETPTIYDAVGNVLNINSNVILENPLYFGQNDLALTKKGYEFELLNKIIGVNIDTEESTDDVLACLKDNIAKLIAIADIPTMIANLESQNAELTHKLTIYKEKGLDEKLRKQTAFNNDLIKLERVVSHYDNRVAMLEAAIKDEDVSSLGLNEYVSEFNPDIISEMSQIVMDSSNIISEIGKNISRLKSYLSKMRETRDKLASKIDSLKDEFAQIKREINDDKVDVDSYVLYQKKLAANNEEIDKLKETLKQKQDLENRIKIGFVERNRILHIRFQKYENAVREINSKQENIKVDIAFKGNKSLFKDDLVTQFKGTGVSDAKYEEIANAFSDFPELIEEYFLNNGEKISKILSANAYGKVSTRILENYGNFLSLECKNEISIKYHDRLLSRQSLGQRASALILFILTQHDSDVIIIDQPEDDLDNQVIYNELIKTIKKEKPNMQFIFATHNANIPVLGDAERVVTTIFDGDGQKILLDQGNIDSKKTHMNIVDIMEGGKDAFDKRNEIYCAWR